MNLEKIAVIGWSLVIISMLAFIIKVAYNTIKSEKERKKSAETYAYTSLFKDADEKIGNFASSFIKSLDPLKEKFDDLGNAISLAISSATPPKEEIKFVSFEDAIKELAEMSKK